MLGQGELVNEIWIINKVDTVSSHHTDTVKADISKNTFLGRIEEWWVVLVWVVRKQSYAIKHFAMPWGWRAQGKVDICDIRKQSSNPLFLSFFTEIFFSLVIDHIYATISYHNMTNAANVTGSARDKCTIQLRCYPRVNLIPVYFLKFERGALTSFGNVTSISKSFISDTVVKRNIA